MKVPIEVFSKRILSASPDKDETYYTWTCNFCGNPVPPLHLELGEQVRLIRKLYCDCPAARSAKEAQDKEELLQERQRKAKQLIFEAGLNIGKRKRMQFSTWDPTRNPEADSVMQSVLEYTDAVAQAEVTNWLYLYGNYGLGKTHLAMAAVRKIVYEQLWQPCAVTWPEHCSRVQQSWNQDYNRAELSEARLWGQMKTAGILLIDDIDKRQPTPWAMGKLYEVVDYRYLREKPTIITANRSLLELLDLWSQKSVEAHDSGAAIISRIAEQLWATVRFTGQDQRMR